MKEARCNCGTIIPVRIAEGVNPDTLHGFIKGHQAESCAIEEKTKRWYFRSWQNRLRPVYQIHGSMLGRVPN